MMSLGLETFLDKGLKRAFLSSLGAAMGSTFDMKRPTMLGIDESKSHNGITQDYLL